ncbi:MAG: Chromate resistance exported protein [Verrucomicrobiales bacterium]|nr:Chromate resistance exported protein [Verrucomicrobiales bacterium]
MTVPNRWLLYLYKLPTAKGAARLGLWRQLKKSGALSLKTSAYLLPDTVEHHERLQWLAQKVRDAKGEATIIHVTEIEGLSNVEIVQQFNQARAQDYEALLSTLNKLTFKSKKKPNAAFFAVHEKVNHQFEEIRKIDFFKCPRAQDVQMLLTRVNGVRDKSKSVTSVLSTKKFQGKTWLTRPRPEVDRVASAWLIRKCIDPKGKFIFGAHSGNHPEAIPYDMYEAEFSHHGDDCTFETLIKRFGINDEALVKIGEMVHDTDLDDGKFSTVECFGIHQVLKGWAKSGLSDHEILSKGGDCFDALYQQLKK